MAARPGILTVEELVAGIEAGEIDTVLMVFPDLQGRLMGKRVTGAFFAADVLAGEGAVHACNYLLAVDVDMTPLPGYRFANWDQGYGDVKCVPDLTTLRRIPWLERTALVICDVFDEDTGAPVEVSPRQILRRQVERAAAHGLTVKCGAELEFFLFRDSYEEAAAKGYRDLLPHSDFIEDYHILQTTKDEYLIRQIRNGMDGAGVPVEFSKGEAGRGQHEINLRYAEVLEMADRHTIYKNGAKEIAALNGRSLTFMAKWDMAEVGSSCHLHSSVWDATGDRSLMWSPDAPHHLSETFRHWMGGLLATTRELAWCYAPFVNSYKRYQPDSWAPTAIVWGHDNRTCGYRVYPKHKKTASNRGFPVPTPTCTWPLPRRSPPGCTGSTPVSNRGIRTRPTPTRPRGSAGSPVTCWKRSTPSRPARSPLTRSAPTSTTTSSTPAARSGRRSIAS